jgi:hypothetical protein
MRFNNSYFDIFNNSNSSPVNTKFTVTAPFLSSYEFDKTNQLIQTIDRTTTA